MKLLVTGTRSTKDKLLVINTLSLWWDDHSNEDIILINGACPNPTGKGAVEPRNNQRILFSVDMIAIDFAGQARWPVDKYPARWYNSCDSNCHHKQYPNKYCPAAGPRRNALMISKLNPDTDEVLAFPSGESSGTRGTIDLASASGIKTTVYELGE